MKKIIALLLVLMLALSLVTACGADGSADTVAPPAEADEAPAEADEAPEEADEAPAETTDDPAEPAEQVEITIWGWADQAVEPSIELFESQNPNVRMIYVQVDPSDYIQRLQTAMMAGMDLPDIGMLELSWRGRLFELDIWANLEEAPFNFDKNELFEAAIVLGTNFRGELVSIDWSACPAGLAFKRPLALEFFGTDDPDELKAMLPDWDSFIQMGIDLQEMSGGDVFMMPGIGDIAMILDLQEAALVVEGTYANITDTWGGIFERVETFRDNNIVDRLGQWSPAWSASFALDNHIFYPVAPWVPDAVIVPNDPTHEGRWGMIPAPGGAYNWGGTSLSITETSEHKEEAWEFIRLVVMSREGAEMSRTDFGYFTTVKSFYEDPDFVNWTPPAFGGQNIGEVLFVDILPNMIQRPITPFDHIVRESADLILQEMIANENLSASEATQMLIIELGNRAEELTVR